MASLALVDSDAEVRAGREGWLLPRDAPHLPPDPRHQLAGDLKGLLAQCGWKDVKTPQVHYQQHRTSQHDLDDDALMEFEEGRKTREVDDDDAAYR